MKPARLDNTSRMSNSRVQSKAIVQVHMAFTRWRYAWNNLACVQFCVWKKPVVCVFKCMSLYSPVRPVNDSHRVSHTLTERVAGQACKVLIDDPRGRLNDLGRTG